MFCLIKISYFLRKYTGTVRSVLDFGAFVDIGAESDGLLHISRISKESVWCMIWSGPVWFGRGKMHQLQTMFGVC